MADPSRRTWVIDLDGPVLETRQRHHAVYRDVLAALGGRPLALAGYWRMTRWGAGAGAILEATGDAGVGPAFRAGWEREIEAAARLALDTVQPGARAALADVRARGEAAVIVTLRSSPVELAAQLAALGLDSAVDRIVAVPHAEGPGAEAKVRHLRATLPRLDPRAARWVGDSEVDVRAARLLGCPVVAVTCGVRDGTFLERLRPDAIVPTLARALAHART
jgi:phosphoglycolate phosphatase